MPASTASSAWTSDATVGFLQRSRAVHVFTRHTLDVAALLRDIHYMTLMLEEHLDEAFSLRGRCKMPSTLSLVSYLRPSMFNWRLPKPACSSIFPAVWTC